MPAGQSAYETKAAGQIMVKSQGRKTKKKVGRILTGSAISAARKSLDQIPEKKLVNYLMSYFYDRDELIKFRSIYLFGELVADMAEHSMEDARVVLRRLMWNLNDESGGIGWGSPEAMGEILSRNRKLADEYKSILFSYLEPGPNFIEHEMLQNGVIWGVGSYLSSHPDDLDEPALDVLAAYLSDHHLLKKAYALRALFNSRYFFSNPLPGDFVMETKPVEIFMGWNFVKTTLADMVMACENIGKPVENIQNQNFWHVC